MKLKEKKAEISAKKLNDENIKVQINGTVSDILKMMGMLNGNVAATLMEEGVSMETARGALKAAVTDGMILALGNDGREDKKWQS